MTAPRDASSVATPTGRIIDLDVPVEAQAMDARPAAADDGRAPAILGIGLARPSGRLGAEAAAEHAAARCGADPAVRARVRRHARRAGIRSRASVISDELDAFYPRCTGDERPAGPGTAARMARYELEAPPLAIAAARRAMRAAGGVSPERITHLVLVSCTGFVSPGVDHGVIAALGLPTDVQRTTVGFMGCHGALNGLRTAAHAVRAEPGARVLVVAVELCSLHFAYGDHPQRLIANTLFADGAAALVVGRDARVSSASRRTGGAPMRLLAHGGGIIPGSAGQMSWRIGDDGFLMTLEPAVPHTVEATLGDWIDRWLGRHGRRRDDVRHWIVHPGGPRILDAAERSLGLERGALIESRRVLRTCGNMSSPTVIFALRRALQRGAGRDGPVVLVGLGPGLSIEATLLG